MIHSNLTIPERELRFETSRSSGPGGQNVNKIESRVTLLFDITSSTSLDAEQKVLLRSRLAGRINRRGVLRIVSQRHRTQAANRKATVKRFVALLGDALVVQRPRKSTTAPAAEGQRRMEEKRRRGRLKQGRHRTDVSDAES